MTIGEKITQRRLATHLSQEILAERLGVSTQDVSRWESGEVLPDAEKLLQLAASSASPPMNCWGRMPRLMMRPTSCLFHCGGGVSG